MPRIQAIQSLPPAIDLHISTAATDLSQVQAKITCALVVVVRAAMAGLTPAALLSIDAPGQKLDCVMLLAQGAGRWTADLAAAILETPEAWAKAVCMLRFFCCQKAPVGCAWLISQFGESAPCQEGTRSC